MREVSPVIEMIANMLWKLDDRLRRLEALSEGEGFANYTTEELHRVQSSFRIDLEWIRDVTASWRVPDPSQP